jgi:hypothetical protein
VSRVKLRLLVVTAGGSAAAPGSQIGFEDSRCLLKAPRDVDLAIPTPVRTDFILLLWDEGLTNVMLLVPLSNGTLSCSFAEIRSANFI